MFKSILSRLLFSAVFCLCLAPAVYADNVVITEGSLNVFPPFGSLATFRINFSGANFNAQAAGDSSAAVCLAPCTRGILRTSASGSDIHGFVDYQGIAYSLGMLTGPGSASGSFDLIAPSFIIPPELLNEAQLRITAPFTLSGGVMIFGMTESIVLTGQGTVVLLLAQGSSGLRTIGLDYTIGDTPAGLTIQAVPEPATLLLLATGLLAVAVKRLSAG